MERGTNTRVFTNLGFAWSGVVFQVPAWFKVMLTKLGVVIIDATTLHSPSIFSHHTCPPFKEEQHVQSYHSSLGLVSVAKPLPNMRIPDLPDFGGFLGPRLEAEFADHRGLSGS